VVKGIVAAPPTTGRFTGGIIGAAVRDTPVEGMYGNETFGNGTERPDGRVRLGIGIGRDTDVSTS